MQAKNPTPRRKWLYIAAGVTLAIPILVILLLAILMQVHRLRPNQIQPPAKIAKLKTNSQTPVKLPASANPTFADFFALTNGDEAADLYRKYWNQVNNRIALMNRKPGQPLSPADKQWLLDHRDMIEGLIRMCKLSGKPIMTCEQAAAMTREERYQFALPDFGGCQPVARLLAAEAERRRESGDMAGAAEALMAIHPLAQTVREPGLINHLIAIATQAIADKELSEWIGKGSIPADVARSMRDQLSKQAIGLPDYRRTIETEYEFTRRELVDSFSLSTPDLVREWIAGGDQKRKQQLQSEGMLDLMWKHPRDFAVVSVAGTVAKANASTIIDRYDSMYAKAFKSIDENSRAGKMDTKILDLPFAPSVGINVDESHTRTNCNLTTLRLDLAGLDLIAGAPASELDPFTNKPLKTIQQDNATLIYSVGPDLKDDHGSVIYDPNQGTFSAGDIVLRIPR